MAVKSAYRLPKESKPEIPNEPAEPNIPAVEINGLSPQAEARIEREEADAERIGETLGEQAAGDANRSRLQEQIAALRQSEQLQRDHYARMAAFKPPTREQKLEYWKQAGMPERDLKFLEDHPEMVDHDAVTAAASNAVLANGMDHDDPGYPDAVREMFDKHMRHLQAQGAAQAPAFFRPPPPRPASEPSPSSFVSAPVSRGDVGSSYREPTNPSQVKLTPEELQIAAASQISPTEYARQKLRLAAEKKSGLRQ